MAGSFNDWQPEALEQQEDGEWVATLQLGPGTHLYKWAETGTWEFEIPLTIELRYVVDGEWLVDPTKETVSDVKGHTNNVVVVEDKVSKWQKQVELVISLALSPPLKVALHRSRGKERSFWRHWKQAGRRQDLDWSFALKVWPLVRDQVKSINYDSIETLPSFIFCRLRINPLYWIILMTVKYVPCFIFDHDFLF